MTMFAIFPQFIIATRLSGYSIVLIVQGRQINVLRLSLRPGKRQELSPIAQHAEPKTLEAMCEVEDMKRHSENYKGYNDVQAMFDGIF
jgi:hypothetical protein